MARPKEARAREAVEKVKAFIGDEDGLETIEYAIMAGLIVAGVLVTIASLSLWISARFERLKAILSGGGGQP
ncbi:MAG: Flp family type IVb pilin [Phycisphaerae bacterium]